MAPLELQALLEVPMRRLQNVKTLICWPSRMHIYCSVEKAYSLTPQC